MRRTSPSETPAADVCRQRSARSERGEVLRVEESVTAKSKSPRRLMGAGTHDANCTSADPTSVKRS